MKRLFMSSWVVLLVLSCAQPADPPPVGTPRLVVIVVVDQMQADFLDRYDRFWDGGLRWMLDNSVRFNDAHHDHAVTATAPGHATLATGCFPSRHAIYSNYWIDRESGEEVYSAADDDWNTTPERMQCSTLGDWMKARYPTSKVFGLSAKDRSAVLAAGDTADGAFFYESSIGGWESDSFYYEEEPAWVSEFNDRRELDRFFGQPWETLPASPEDLAAVGVETFELGPLEADLPIAFGGLSPTPNEGFYSAIYSSPFVDEHMGRFAQHLIGSEALGGDEVPDLLALSFSATDAVGHTFGPDSPQLLDTLRRLDRTLAELFEFIDRRIGLDQTVIALSADHGSVSLPELRTARGLPAKRADAEDVLCMQRVHERLQGRLGEGDWLSFGTFVNREAAKEAGIEVEEIERVAAELMSACPSVERVYTRTQLLDPSTAEDPMGRLFAHSYHPDSSPDFLLLRKEFFLATRTTATSHGTAWRYDTHVPLLIATPGGAPAVRRDYARTADLAPTLSRLIGVDSPEEIDGVDLFSPAAPTDGE